MTQCDICGMVYTVADPSDETMHHKFHQGLLSALKFPVCKAERLYSQISMARTSLGPWKFVREMGSSSQ